LRITFDEPTLADAEEIARVHVQCWHESYANLLPAEFLRKLSADARVAQWQTAISDPEVFVRVAREAGRIAGFVSCGAAREDAARFWLSKGGRNLIVLSMAGNTQATAFYEALGGVQVYEGSFEIAGTSMADRGHLFNNLAALAVSA